MRVIRSSTQAIGDDKLIALYIVTALVKSKTDKLGMI